MESSWPPPHRRGGVKDHSCGHSQAFRFCQRCTPHPEIQFPPRGPRNTSSFGDLPAGPSQLECQGYQGSVARQSAATELPLRVWTGSLLHGPKPSHPQMIPRRAPWQSLHRAGRVSGNSVKGSGAAVRTRSFRFPGWSVSMQDSGPDHYSSDRRSVYANC